MTVDDLSLELFGTTDYTSVLSVLSPASELTKTFLRRKELIERTTNG